MAKPSTKLTVFDTGGHVAGPATLSAKVTRIDTGAAVPGAVVRFKIDNTLIGEATSKSNGVASLPFRLGQTYAAIKYTISAKFDGNDFFKGSSDVGVFTVIRGNVAITLEARNPAPAGAPLSATLVVHDAAGGAVAERQLRCTLNGRGKSIKTDARGRAAFSIDISPGANIIKVDLSQDDRFNATHREFTITGKAGGRAEGRPKE